MKVFLRRIFILLLPVLLFIVLVNYFGDAANLFSRNYENLIAAEIARKQNVTNILNCDERLLQKAIISQLNECPDIGVIGSSRIMEIRERNFVDSSLINNGVSGASIEDLFALVELYIQKRCLPKKLIIGLDPWLLNKNNDQLRWHSISHEYEASLKRIMPNGWVGENQDLTGKLKSITRWGLRYYTLFSPSYFKSSFRSFFLQDKQPIVVKSPVNKTFTKLADGSVTYDENYRLANKDAVDKKVTEMVRTGLYSIEDYTELDWEIKLKLEFMIQYLQSKTVTVEFFLVPYHPEIYKRISHLDKYKMVAASQQYFLALARKSHIKTYGSFDPADYNLDHKYFYDGMHCSGNGENYC
jgi:hypothetical protein